MGVGLLGRAHRNVCAALPAGLTGGGTEMDLDNLDDEERCALDVAITSWAAISGAVIEVLGADWNDDNDPGHEALTAILAWAEETADLATNRIVDVGFGEGMVKRLIGDLDWHEVICHGHDEPPPTPKRSEGFRPRHWTGR
jgi:hypothetical protein